MGTFHPPRLSTGGLSRIRLVGFDLGSAGNLERTP
jgi:hypothetical protein